MQRRIIQIDQERCNGCGLCAKACHEGAIEMRQGKARLVRQEHCDGLGDCLPVCPTGAIRFIQQQAPAYDKGLAGEGTGRMTGETAGKAAAASKMANTQAAGNPAGCPGMRGKTIPRAQTPAAAGFLSSQLRQWPVQIMLAPPAAPYFQGCRLLLAADCTAYAYGNFHQDFMAGRVALIGCPKLDQTDYSEKLAAIFAANQIQQISVVRMEVPCCSGLEQAVRRGLQRCGKEIPCQVTVISLDGKQLKQTSL